jgi:hypothetical protein
MSVFGKLLPGRRLRGTAGPRPPHPGGSRSRPCVIP